MEPLETEAVSVMFLLCIKKGEDSEMQLLKIMSEFRAINKGHDAMSVSGYYSPIWISKMIKK